MRVVHQRQCRQNTHTHKINYRKVINKRSLVTLHPGDHTHHTRVCLSFLQILWEAQRRTLSDLFVFILRHKPVLKYFYQHPTECPLFKTQLIFLSAGKCPPQMAVAVGPKLCLSASRSKSQSLLPTVFLSSWNLALVP